MRLFGELVVLQDMVEFSEISGVECHDGPRPENRLILVEDLTGGRGDGQRPEEATEALDVPALLQGLANPRDLLGAEIQDRQLEHGGFSFPLRLSLSHSLSPLAFQSLPLALCVSNPEKKAIPKLTAQALNTPGN